MLRILSFRICVHSKSYFLSSVLCNSSIMCDWHWVFMCQIFIFQTVCCCYCCCWKFWRGHLGDLHTPQIFKVFECIINNFYWNSCRMLRLTWITVHLCTFSHLYKQGILSNHFCPCTLKSEPYILILICDVLQSTCSVNNK